MRRTAIVLIGWALWHAIYGHRQRLRVGMQTGLAGLLLLVIPDGERARRGPDAGSDAVADLRRAAVTPGVNLGAAFLSQLPRSVFIRSQCLPTIATVSVLVYEWIGVGFLRRGWVNLDQVWVAALVVCGLVLLAG